MMRALVWQISFLLSVVLTAAAPLNKRMTDAESGSRTIERRSGFKRQETKRNTFRVDLYEDPKLPASAVAISSDGLDGSERKVVSYNVGSVLARLVLPEIGIAAAGIFPGTSPDKSLPSLTFGEVRPNLYLHIEASWVDPPFPKNGMQLIKQTDTRLQSGDTIASLIQSYIDRGATRGLFRFTPLVGDTEETAIIISWYVAVVNKAEDESGFDLIGAKPDPEPQNDSNAPGDLDPSTWNFNVAHSTLGYVTLNEL